MPPACLQAWLACCISGMHRFYSDLYSVKGRPAASPHAIHLQAPVPGIQQRPMGVPLPAGTLCMRQQHAHGPAR